MRLLATRNTSRRVRCGSSFDMYHTLNRAHRGVWAARHLLLGAPPTINELPLAETLCIAVVFQRTSGIGPTKSSRIERVCTKDMSHNRASWKHTKACFADELLGRHEMIKLSLSPNKQIQVHHARCLALPTSHRVRGCAASLPHHCVGCQPKADLGVSRVAHETIRLCFGKCGWLILWRARPFGLDNERDSHVSGSKKQLSFARNVR